MALTFPGPETSRTDAPHLSVVVPMYREAARIGATLTDMTAWLRGWDETSEVVLVDDGSPDHTTSVVAPFLTDRPHGPLRRVRLVRLERNLGKGGAVRAGLAQSTGRFVLMMDADNAAAVREVEKLLAARTPRSGIVAGSRASRDADVQAVAFRALTGLAFRSALTLLGMNILRDTQCGFKLYDRRAAHIAATLGRENGYTFDLEHLLLVKRAGLSVLERGIAWRHVEGGQVSAVSDGLKMLRAAAKLRQRLRTIPDAEIKRALAEASAPAVMIEAKPAALVTS